MAELQVAARGGKNVGFSCPGQLKWLWASSSQVWEDFLFLFYYFFLTCWNRIIRLTERGWIESKEKRTEDKVSTLTAVRFFTGEVIFTLNGLWSILVQHVMSPCRAVLHSKLLTAASCYLVDEKYFFEGGLLNRICGFHLVIDRNGYFVYFPSVVQIFCNKTKIKHSEMFKRMATCLCWRTSALFFFLIGTENV